MQQPPAMGRGKGKNSTTTTPRSLTHPRTARLETFFAPQAASPARSQSPKMASSPSRPEFSLPDLRAASQRIERSLAEMPTRADIREMIAEVRDSLQQDISNLRTEVETLETRVAGLEHEATCAAEKEQQEPSIPPQTLSGVWRKLDDLHIRSRRQNLRIRGVPETETATRRYLVGLFNFLLGAREVHPEDLARAHRALRPTPTSPDEPPRDIICCLSSFTLKERIYLSARAQRTWDFRGARISIFNDLSPTTFQARRFLRPVTQVLQREKIPYRWGYPLSLSVRHNNLTLSIRTPEDVSQFMRSLNLPELQVQAWETFDFRPQLGPEAPLQGGSSPQRHRPRQRPQRSLENPRP
uniref:Uncharacterized protein n=1 Tax=Leptobrachium leishanense TaxID=445787 RepID=A0A8C5PYF3_9ANUR